MTTQDKFLQAGTGAVNRTVNSKIAEVLTVTDFGALGDGVTDDQPAIQLVADIANGKSDDTPVIIVFPEGNYAINSTISFNKPNLTIVAYGARFIPLSDVVMFDFNSTALADASVVVREVKFLGGYFDYLDAPTTLIGTAIKGHSTRSVTIRDVRFRGIKNCIEVALLDTLRVQDCYFRNFEKGVYIPVFHTSGGSIAQDIWITGNTFSVKTGITCRCVDVASGVSDMVVRDNGAALQTGYFVYMDADDLGLAAVLIENNATEQATSQTLIKVNTAGTNAIENITVQGNNFGSSGATVIDVDRLEGVANIADNHFINAAQTAIVMASIRPDATVHIDRNNFKQNATNSGVLWDLTFVSTARGFIGDNTYDLSDIGARTDNSSLNIQYTTGRYESIASATAMTILPDTKYAAITGTTNITSIPATWRGHEVFIQFAGSITISDTTSIKLAGAFSGITNDTLTIVCNGTNWFEKSRSVN